MKKLSVQKIRIKKGSFIYFFLLFSLLLCLPILLFGIVYYNKLDKRIEEEVTRQHHEILQNIKSDIEMRIFDLDTLAIKLTNSSWIKKIAFMQSKKIEKKRVSINETIAHVEQLRTHEVLNPFTACISVLFPDKDYVVSSHGISAGNIFYNELFECEDFNYQDIINVAQNIYESKLFYTKNLNINTLQRDGRKMGEALIYISPLNYNTFNKAIMVAYIPISNIEKVVTNKLNPSLNQITIYDEDGQTLINTFSDKEQSLPNNEYTSISLVNRWHYVMSIPKSTYSNSKRNMRIGVSIVALFMLIFMILIIYYLSSCQIAPLRELCKSLGYNLGGWYKKQEISYFQLENLISLTIENGELLKQQNETFKPLIKKGVALKILYGIHDENEVHFIKDRNDPVFPYSQYTICLLVSEKHINLEKLKSYIDNLRDEVVSHCLKVGDVITAIILNHLGNERVDVLLEELDLILSQKYTDDYGTLFVGNTCSDISEIKVSFKEAQKLLEYRGGNCEGTSTVCYYSDLVNNSNVIYYPIYIEIKIINALKEGNYKSIKDMLNHVINKNKEKTGSLLGNARLLAYSLITTAVRAVESINQEYDYSKDYLVIEMLDDADKILEYIRELYQDIIETFNTVKSEVDNDILFKINRFMENNYCSNDISLSMLAVHVGKPEYYISRFFKRNYGVNFLEYLHKMRLKKAKELLDSGLTIQEVAKTTGYISDVTFRRTFKKYEGITPSEYRSIF